MSDYDFNQLNDKEFEILVADLVSDRDKVRYERFKPGKDHGVDGRYFRDDGNEVILQCKHWCSTPLTKLINHLQKTELPKIKKLNPARYVIAISQGLSRSDKSKIQNCLNPYVKETKDILGREDLNDLLSKYPETEKRHYKLWITSTNILQYLLNKPILDRSEFSIKEFINNTKLYVPTINHHKAIEKLEEQGTVILSGSAGIGKTTLADQLSLHYFRKKFAFIRIAEDIKEAEAVYDFNKLQLFYFDDFLGRNYLEALSGHEGMHIVQFIKRIMQDRKKRFILTSRSTILNQGKLLIDLFKTINIKKNEFEIKIDSYSEIDRAQILYNHIWHSKLSSEYIDEIYKNKRYKEIIKHRNYNPRLIRYITDSMHLHDCPPELYWQHANELLRNPVNVWENPFQAQLDDYGRLLVLLVTLNGKPITQNALNDTYVRFLKMASHINMNGSHDFLINLNHLVGSFLNKTIIDSIDSKIDLFNPSIGDYVLRRYAEDLSSLKLGFASLNSISSLHTLLNLLDSNIIKPDSAIKISKHILQESASNDFANYSIQYIALVLSIFKKSIGHIPHSDNTIEKALRFVISSKINGEMDDVIEIFSWAYDNELISKENLVSFIHIACKNITTITEQKNIAKLINKIDNNSELCLFETLEEITVSFFSETINDDLSIDDIFNDIDTNSSEEIKEKIYNLIENYINFLGIPISCNGIQRILEEYDISRGLNNYLNYDDEYFGTDDHYSANNQFDEIDDLFDRSNYDK